MQVSPRHRLSGETPLPKPQFLGLGRAVTSFNTVLKTWVIKIARPFVPQLKDTSVDEVIMGLGDTLDKDGQPIYVNVDDDETGEHVQIYIG